MISTLRVIGDVHGQIDSDSLFTRDARPYLDIISDAPHSIQLGDMGDGETYDHLIASVDANRHRFFPGNHESYDRLPPHNLGDFGSVSWGEVNFFFVRGAESTDREVLLQLGSEEGKKLWFEQEELTEEQMRAAEHEYLRARPQIVLSHDAPTHVARSAWQHARRFSPPNSRAKYSASRTTDFLERLLGQHQPRVWLFGHHHHDWRLLEGGSLFVCVGELSHVDIDSSGLPLPFLRSLV
jgi:predicted phosphodiesterase